MTDTDSENRLIRIFNELKEKGLIARNRRLIPNPFVSSFQGLFVILYSRKNIRHMMSRLDDNALRYVLLHEESHLRKGAFSNLKVVLFPLVAGLILFAYPFHMLIDLGLQAGNTCVMLSQFGSAVPAALAAIVFALIAIPLFYRLFYHELHQDEFDADRYAAETLKEHFSIDRPSEILDTALTCIQGMITVENQNVASRLFSGLILVLGIYPDYHPPVAARVETVRREVDGQSPTALPDAEASTAG
ncbi:MAG: hypothetical protein KO206_00390 [Methanomicrobiaceae archaeon]|uniref:Uncharacterized protein n=1 Tax=hydrocarbon metagenome TaxID=938273 RepID=A0A0W8FFR7_9ZZZZ|nr:hypothetical protein [Methanomicrobiaceae archaeon]MDD5418894.1 hypothetical protein [Methanomicrobiaceae archaeon]